MIRPILHKTLRQIGCFEHYGLFRSRALDDLGWTRSAREGKPIDREGRALPWITYSAIHFLEPRLSSSLDVFEYGSGASTRWWASHVASVISCEHDSDWAAKTSAVLPENAVLRHTPLGDDRYARQVVDEGKSFDLVMIDGRERVACAANAIKALSTQGVIVWDNSDRIRYQAGIAHLTGQGFRRIAFSGLVPSAYTLSETSVLYRDSNCLGI